MASKEESHLMLIMVPVVEWNYILHVCSVGVSYSQTRVHLLFVASFITIKIDFSPHNPCFGTEVTFLSCYKRLVVIPHDQTPDMNFSKAGRWATVNFEETDIFATAHETAAAGVRAPCLRT